MSIFTILSKRIYDIILFVILSTLILSAYWVTDMPGSSYHEPMPDPTEKQKRLAQTYQNEMDIFAHFPRNHINMKNLHAAENLIITQLTQAGFQIHEQVFNDKGMKNIEVVIEPKGKVTQTVVLGAHYDTVETTPGADDNASSVVVLLELAQRLKNLNSEHTRFRIVFFGNEEPPYFRTEQMGSMSYAYYLHHEKEPIVAMFAFDAIGYYSDEKGSQSYPLPFSLLYPNTANFIGFVGNMKSKPLVKSALAAFREQAQFPSEGISAPAWIPGIDFSDHLSFYRFGYPAVMITDTAFNRNKNYHQPTDKIETLNLIKMAQLTDELERMFRTLYH